MLKNPDLSMDALVPHDGDLFLVVEPNKLPFARVFTNYLDAKSIQQKHTTNGLLIMLTHDTIQQILKDPNMEIVV